MIEIKPEFIPYEEPLSTRRRAKDHVFRFFSERHAARYAFPTLSTTKRLLLAHTIITADGRFAYIKNYKAGCTAVAHLLYVYDHGRTTDGSMHGDLMKRPMDFPAQSFSFSTVRNPERRAVSCFYNFFVSGLNPVAKRHTDKLDQFGFFRKDDLHYRFDVFLDYVEANFEFSVLRCDGHFRPQYMNLGHRIVTLSDIARLETLDADLARISEKAGRALPHMDALHGKQTNVSGSEKLIVDKRQRARLETIYAKDYEIYGY